MNDFILDEYVTVRFDTVIPDWFLSITKNLSVYFGMMNIEESLQNVDLEFWLDKEGKQYLLDYMTKLKFQYEFFDLQKTENLYGTNREHTYSIARGIVFKSTPELSAWILAISKPMH
jgi:hypothetical protein